MDSGEPGFLWITEILNPRYQEDQRERLAGQVVEVLGEHFLRKGSVYFTDIQPAWIPPLLEFLSLSEKLDATRSTRFVALRILATSPGYANFGPMILPVLTSSLLPAHPLQARHLALNIFLKFMSGWFPSQMENIPSKYLDKLVQAVGDPFQFQDLPLQDGKHVDLPNNDPMMVTAVLIEFASSGLWRNHLRRSNFISFEEMVSTRDGKTTAVRCMLRTAFDPFPEFLRTASKISMAVMRLEELQCPNSVEAVIMWAWTVGAVNPVDHDGLRLIGHHTLQFYQTHGMERLITLKQHVTEMALDTDSVQLLLRPWERFQVDTLPVISLSQACQLRRLYRLFGFDSVTWNGVVEAVDVDEEMYVSSGRSITRVPSMDWACDYP